MESIFTKIVRGEIPSYKIAEDEKFYAFLDMRPLTKGHTLVVPKIEVDYFFDLDDDTIGEMMVFAKKIAVKIKDVTKCRKVGVAVIGLEVPYAHLHLIPMNTESDIDFKKEREHLSEMELRNIMYSLQM